MMPRFFFDTYDGERFFPDEKGMELESIEAAKVEGQKALPDMAKDAPPNGNFLSFVVSVRDEGGQVVLRIALSLIVEEGCSGCSEPSHGPLSSGGAQLHPVKGSDYRAER